MSSDDSPIPGLTSTPAARRAEFTKRRRLFDEQKVNIKLVEDLRRDGWEPFNELKTGIKVRRKKSIDEILENRFWSILYWLGYEKLNIGRNFTLLISQELQHGAATRVETEGSLSGHQNQELTET